MPKQTSTRRFALALLFGWLLSACHASFAAAEQNTFRLVVFGDSLTAGYRLPLEDAYPKVLEKTLRTRGHKVEVISASVSGDTSTGGLARLDWALNGKIDGVIVELGANDMLRGIDPDRTRAALDAIVTRIKAKGAKVLLAGMLAAPGMGKTYEDNFRNIYPALAKKHGVGLIPFFLEGVAGNKRLNLPDGIHPNPAGVHVMVGNSLPFVEKMLARASGAR